jgi:hypothetical protein
VDRCRREQRLNTHIARKGMKEGAVLIILKVFINLVLPDYSARAYEVDKGKEMGSSATVRCEHEGAL